MPATGLHGSHCATLLWSAQPTCRGVLRRERPSHARPVWLLPNSLDGLACGGMRGGGDGMEHARSYPLDMLRCDNIPAS